MPQYPQRTRDPTAPRSHYQQKKVQPTAVPAIRLSAGGGDFLSKIEASMQMLQTSPDRSSTETDEHRSIE